MVTVHPLYDIWKAISILVGKDTSNKRFICGKSSFKWQLKKFALNLSTLTINSVDV
jgi:hypothetical protein